MKGQECAFESTQIATFYERVDFLHFFKCVSIFEDLYMYASFSFQCLNCCCHLHVYCMHMYFILECSTLQSIVALFGNIAKFLLRNACVAQYHCQTLIFFLVQTSHANVETNTFNLHSCLFYFLLLVDTVCPEGWSFFQTSCYKVYTEGKSRQAAKKTCADQSTYHTQSHHACE